MGMLTASSLQDSFATVTDPRCPDAPNSRQQRMDILVMAVGAVMCGAEGWEAMEDDGKSQTAWFEALRDVPHGIPGHDTFRRVGSRLAPEALPQCFIAWPEALSDVSGGELGAIDGKTGRHACAPAASPSAIHLVSAWASANRLVLGQLQGDETSNELPAIPTLFPLLDVHDALVTMDAMGGQHEMARVMTEQEAESVGALPEKHKTLYEEVPLLFAAAMGTECADMAHEYHAPVEGDHGRSATRRYGMPSDIAWGGATAAWPQLQRVGMVEARRAVGDAVQIDARSFLTSLPAQGVRCAHAVRQHWGMENALHGVLDVSFDADACRIRKDKGAQTFSVLRHIALTLGRRERHHQRGIKARRKRAGWDRDYLAKVLTGVS